MTNKFSDYFDKGDGKKSVKPKDEHYADKGGHGARHDLAQQQREEERRARREDRKNNDKGR